MLAPLHSQWKTVGRMKFATATLTATALSVSALMQNKNRADELFHLPLNFDYIFFTSLLMFEILIFLMYYKCAGKI